MLPGICDGGDGVDSTNAGRCTAAVAIATLGPIPAARPYFVVSVGCTGVEKVQEAIADDACFAIVFPCVLELHCDTSTDERRVSEISSASRWRLLACGRIGRDSHTVIVETNTLGCELF